MAVFIIPAEPGYRARWKHGDCIREEPIIAWRIESAAIVPRAVPLGIWGNCDDNAVIIAPDGKRVPPEGRLVKE